MTDHYSYSDFMKNSTARFSNMTTSYSKFDNENSSRYNWEKELFKKIELKNQENYKLRIELENEIKSRDNLMYDFQQLENELEYIKKRSFETEHSLNSKLRILEIEKNILEERANFRDTRNDLLKDKPNDKRLGIVTTFLNNDQKMLINPQDFKLVTGENLTENFLSDRFNLIESELKLLTGSNGKNTQTY